MSRPDGHITNDTRFGGSLRLSPPTREYGKVRDPEAGERRHKIEDIETQRVLDKEDKEIWE